jgi:hypothetical protein
MLRYYAMSAALLGRSLVHERDASLPITVLRDCESIIIFRPIHCSLEQYGHFLKYYFDSHNAL